VTVCVTAQWSAFADFWGNGHQRLPTESEDPLIGAEDGIRTRDPHLGKVVSFVWLIGSSRPACAPVHPCSRALYTESTSRGNQS